MSPIPSNYLTATETIALVKSDQLTVTQLAKDHLARYHERNDSVHAWAWIDEERILREAARLDALSMGERGPLHGMILGVKDMMNMPTQHGSKMYKDHQPGEDATAIAVLRQAGALLYAKTASCTTYMQHTTEFAAVGVGKETSNPFDKTRTPGGSSSGSAAGVRDYQCQVALGTQTGGSMIRPGTFNHVYAYKPTWGAISREGLKTVSLLLDTLGFFARSIQDLELFADVFGLHDDVPPPQSPKSIAKCRFLFVKTQSWELLGTSPELVRAWSEAKRLLRDAGAEVVEHELGPDFDGIAGEGNRHKIVERCDGRANFLAEYVRAEHRAALDPDILRDCENSDGFTRKQQLAAYDSMAALRPVIDRIAGEYDAIVTPSINSQAPVGLAFTGDPRYNSMWTLLHVPVINVPGFASEQGMPIGLSLVAPRYEDQRLLSVAKSVAGVWSKSDEAKLNSIPRPEGVELLQI